MTCEGGHALFRTYDAGAWYLACCACPHRILEGRAVTPGPKVVDLTIPHHPTTPEETEVAA